jgi:hypothetical protein
MLAERVNLNQDQKKGVRIRFSRSPRSPLIAAGPSALHFLMRVAKNDRNRPADMVCFYLPPCTSLFENLTQNTLDAGLPTPPTPGHLAR